MSEYTTLTGLLMNELEILEYQIVIAIGLGIGSWAGILGVLLSIYFLSKRIEK